jgi:hypothetical protein
MKLRKIFLSFICGFAIVSFSACNWGNGDYSKENLHGIIKINDSLYNETFLIRSIINDTERYSEYITDSVSFRKYVCTHDFGETLHGEMGKNGDYLAVYKVKGSISEEKRVVFDTVFINTYNINELKREGKFE